MNLNKNIDLDKDLEEKTDEELINVLSNIVDHSLYKTMGDGRICNEKKDRIRIKYCKLALNAVKEQLEHKRETNALESLTNGDVGAPQNQCVYIVSCNGKHKIGFSNNPHERVESMQVGNPFEMELVAFSETKNASALEKKYHDMYSEYNTRGEWFDFPPRVLDDVIESIKKLSSEDANQVNHED